MATAAKGALRASFTRTLVPLIVGYVVSLAARHGWHINDDQAASTITAVGAYLYYAAARFLETHASSKFGWLLGDARQPVYPTATPLSAVQSSGSHVL